MEDAPPPRRITRYGNRKLYDLEARRYVTLEALGGLVADGHDVEVSDQRTGEDLTSLTLAQVLLEGLRQRTARIPRPLLVQLVRLSAGPRARGPAGPSPARRAAGEAERIARDLIARGRLTLEEALSLRQEILRSISAAVSEAQQGLDASLHGLLGGRKSPARATSRRESTRKKRRAPRPTRGRRQEGARR